MVVGLVWVVATYLFRGEFPIPGIGNWNLGIGFGLTWPVPHDHALALTAPESHRCCSQLW